MAQQQSSLFSSENLKTIWEAAHWDKRLTRKLIETYNIPISVSSITSASNLYSLRISGFLLLGLSKIYQKKAIIIKDEIAQAISGLQIPSENQSLGVLDMIGLTKVSTPVQLTPPNLISTHSLKPYKPIKKLLNSKATNEYICEDYNFVVKQEIESFGISYSFLNDIEIAEKWVMRESDSQLPEKRKKRNWEELIDNNLVKFEENLNQGLSENNSGNHRLGPDLHLSDRNDLSDIIPQGPIKPIKSPIRLYETPRKKRKIPNEDLSLDPKTYASTIYTSELVKNINYYSKEISVMPKTPDLIFYQPIIRDMPKDLENFYLSNIKIHKLKAALTSDDSEPLILSSVNSTTRPINFYIKTEANTANYDCDYIQDLPAKGEVKPESADVVLKTDSGEDNDDLWGLRTIKLLKLIRNRSGKSFKKQIWFDELTNSTDRKVLACGFYELLQLALKDCIHIEKMSDRISIRCPTEFNI